MALVDRASSLPICQDVASRLLPSKASVKHNSNLASASADNFRYLLLNPCTPKGKRFSCKRGRRGLAVRWQAGNGLAPVTALKNDCEKAAPAKGTPSELLDVISLGNLCVDLVVNVNELPPEDVNERRKYLAALAAKPPPESCWEGGGNANFTISAARLGLKTACLGHVGNEIYGNFFQNVLQTEGVGLLPICEEGAALGGEDYDGNTLLCWVLVDPASKHSFISRFDFNKNPAFSRLTKLPPAAEAAIRKSRAVFCNGFAFDELPPATILAATAVAHEAGAKVFFDPGPRGKTFMQQEGPQRRAVEALLQASDVALLTDDEAEVITGVADPAASAQAVLARGGALQWVVVKRGGQGCVMATHKGIYRLPAYKVDVVDTVGCGDSFAAAVVLGFIQNKDPVATLALANAVGAATAVGKGAGRNVASSELVASILADAQENSSGMVEVNRPVAGEGKESKRQIPLAVAASAAAEVLLHSQAGKLAL